MQENPAGASFQLILLFVFFVIALFFLLTQQKTLEKVSPGNRQISPSNVWLQLIPLFGMVYQFIVITKLSESIRRQLSYVPDDSILGVSEAAVQQPNGRPTYGLGMAYASLNTIGILLNFFMRAPNTFGGYFFIGGTLCFIIYWILLFRYKSQMAANAAF